MKKTFDIIDINKFVASILIFAMHCKALGDFPNADFGLEIIARWGVPFFFISSSYFLFSKSINSNIEKETLYCFIKRIGMLYCLYFIYNLPSIIYQRLYRPGINQFDTWLIFLKNTMLSSTFTGSWYLASSIFSAVFVYSLSKKYKTETIILITFLFHILCIFTSAYYGLLPFTFAKTLGDFLCFPLNIFNGLLYFSLGKYIYENQTSIFCYFSKYKSLLLFFVFYFSYIIEIIITKNLNIFKTTDVAFSTVFIALSLFVFCIHLNVKINSCRTLRKLSVIIYCSQGNTLLVNSFFKKILGFNSLFSFFLASSLTFVICIMVLYVQKHSQWRWTRYLT